MKHNLRQIFKEMKNIEPTPRLAVSILARIEKLQNQQIKRKLAWSYFSLATSGAAFVLAVLELGNSFLQSDFWILLRLLLTDASAVMRNGNDFLFSLLETFPAVSAAMLLIPVFAILLSFSAYLKLINRRQFNYI